MANIQVMCPTCNEALELDAKYTGQEVECGSCFQVFTAKSAKSSSRRGRDHDEDDDRRRSKSSSRKSSRYASDDDDDDDYDDRPRRRTRRRSGRSRSSKTRVAYILLGLFLGGLGIHNFYAGHTHKGTTQLLLTILGIPLSLVFVGIFLILGVRIWSIVDICIVTEDGDGYRMS